MTCRPCMYSICSQRNVPLPTLKIVRAASQGMLYSGAKCDECGAQERLNKSNKMGVMMHNNAWSTAAVVQWKFRAKVER